MTIAVGVDIGGTFTDLFAIDQDTGEIFEGKSLTTPRDFSVGVFDCVDRAGLSVEDISPLVHGSTVAINIAVERTGVRSALVVTRGTRDVYAIGRGNRPDAYNTFFKRPKPLIPRSLTFEVNERKLPSGVTHIGLTKEHATEIAEAVREAGVDAVAVCFLHAYADPEHEELIGRVLRELVPNAHVSVSSEIIREYREYERMSTTALNSYVGPPVTEYISQLERGLADRNFAGRFLIMQSNGGVMSPETAKRMLVATMESGPVAGVMASAQIGERLGYPDTISFDMGGTTAKTSLVRDAEPTIAHGYHIGGYAEGHPAMMPVVDIVEVGAGGGSISWIDDVGSLKVGPRSAAAEPGPICYQRGGSEPTVTDANVVLGRIGVDSFLGGEIQLDRNAACAGVDSRLGSLGLSTIEAAIGIVRVAIAHMVLAVRGVSVERGYDPRDFAMVAQGGNGPLHALEIARELGVPTVIIPRLPAIFSALGMLMTDLRHDYVQTRLVSLADADVEELVEIFDNLVELGRGRLAGEGVSADAMTFERSLDLRYEGQEFALPIPVGADELDESLATIVRARFDAAHEHRYGYAAPGENVGMINLRIVARGRRERLELPASEAFSGDALTGWREVWFDDPSQPENCPVFSRNHLVSGQMIEGPAIVEEHSSTTLLWKQDVATVAPSGELIVKVGTK